MAFEQEVSKEEDEATTEAAKAEPWLKFPLAHRVGVLVVHGIGTQSKGSTLRQFVDSIMGVLRPFARAKRRDDLLKFDLPPSDDDGFVRLTVPSLGATETPTSRWVIGEAWWADAFDAPDRSEVSRWLVGAGPYFAFYFAVRLWRRFKVNTLAILAGVVFASTIVWLGVASATGRGLSWPGLAVGIAAMVTIPFMRVGGRRASPLIVAATLLLLFPLASVATVLMVALYVIGLLPGKWSQKVRALQVSLARGVGDTYALISSPRREAAMFQAITSALKKLTDAADGPNKHAHTPITIVAHSQGAALVYRLFDRAEFRSILAGRPVTLLTYGSAIHPIGLFERHLTDGARPWWLRFQGLIGLLGLMPFVAVLDRIATNAFDQPAAICLGASLVLTTLSFVIVWIDTRAIDMCTSPSEGDGHFSETYAKAAETEENQRDEFGWECPKIDPRRPSPLEPCFRWVDYWAPWDPVPNGPLRLNWPYPAGNPYGTKCPAPTDGFPEPCRVSNEHQPWRDHVVYRFDVEDVVCRWLREIAYRAVGCTESEAFLLPCPEPPGACGPWTQECARKFRMWRGRALLIAQAVLLTGGVIALVSHWRDLEDLGEWLQSNAPSPIRTALSKLVDVVPNFVVDGVAGGDRHDTHLYGLVAASTALLVALLLLALVFKFWNSRPARLYANASTTHRVGAPVRGVMAGLAWTAMVVGAVLITVCVGHRVDDPMVTLRVGSGTGPLHGTVTLTPVKGGDPLVVDVPAVAAGRKLEIDPTHYTAAAKAVGATDCTLTDSANHRMTFACRTVDPVVKVAKDGSLTTVPAGATP